MFPCSCLFLFVTTKNIFLLYLIFFVHSLFQSRKNTNKKQQQQNILNSTTITKTRCNIFFVHTLSFFFPSSFPIHLFTLFFSFLSFFFHQNKNKKRRKDNFFPVLLFLPSTFTPHTPLPSTHLLSSSPLFLLVFLTFFKCAPFFFNLFDTHTSSNHT
eukprot:UN00971